MKLPKPGQQLVIVGEIFTETESRVEQQFFFCDPRLFAAHNVLIKKTLNIGEDVLILRRLLHGFWLSLHMHQTHRQSSFRGGLQRAGLGQRTNIVDDMRPGPGRLANNLRLGGIH